MHGRDIENMAEARRKVVQVEVLQQGMVLLCAFAVDGMATHEVIRTTFLTCATTQKNGNNLFDLIAQRVQTYSNEKIYQRHIGDWVHSIFANTCKLVIRAIYCIPAINKHMIVDLANTRVSDILLIALYSSKNPSKAISTPARRQQRIELIRLALHATVALLHKQPRLCSRSIFTHAKIISHPRGVLKTLQSLIATHDSPELRQRISDVSAGEDDEMMQSYIMQPREPGGFDACISLKMAGETLVAADCVLAHNYSRHVDLCSVLCSILDTRFADDGDVAASITYFCIQSFNSVSGAKQQGLSANGEACNDLCFVEVSSAFPALGPGGQGTQTRDRLLTEAVEQNALLGEALARGQLVFDENDWTVFREQQDIFVPKLSMLWQKGVCSGSTVKVGHRYFQVSGKCPVRFNISMGFVRSIMRTICSEIARSNDPQVHRTCIEGLETLNNMLDDIVNIYDDVVVQMELIDMVVCVLTTANLHTDAYCLGCDLFSKWIYKLDFSPSKMQRYLALFHRTIACDVQDAMFSMLSSSHGQSTQNENYRVHFAYRILCHIFMMQDSLLAYDKSRQLCLENAISVATYNRKYKIGFQLENLVEDLHYLRSICQTATNPQYTVG